MSPAIGVMGFLYPDVPRLRVRYGRIAKQPSRKRRAKVKAARKVAQSNRRR